MAFENRFKHWYSVKDIADTLSGLSDGPVTEADVMDHLRSVDVPVYWDASGRYAVELNRVCYVYLPPTENPLFRFVTGDLTPDDLNALVRGPEGLAPTPDQKVQVLDGYHRIVNERHDALILPVAGDTAEIDFIYGLLVMDPDTGATLQVVKRLQESPPLSLEQEHFHRFPHLTVADIRVSASDLKRIINQPTSESTDSSLGQNERASLQKQVAALALALAEKSGAYRKGDDKPNVQRISDAVADVLSALPDAKKRGVSDSSIRASIEKGLGFLKG